MGNNKMVAVWGSTGGGKTTTSIKVAKELAASKKNVIVVLCDDETPSLPLLLPNAVNYESLGDLLSQPTITQLDVLKHCIPYGNNRYISLLGYKLGDNEVSYSEYSVKRAKELYALLRRTADCVIVDCSHHLLSNVLTATALEMSDCVLKVINADIKSSIYIKSQKMLLQGTQFKYDKQINVLNNVFPVQDISPYSEALGGVSYTLPHLPGLKEQYDSGLLLDSLFGRDAKKYEPVVKELVQEVFDG